MQMAEGYPIEASQANNMERRREILSQWPDSERVFLPHLDERGSRRRRASCGAPYPGENFQQPDLLATLEKLVDSRKEGLAERQEPQRSYLRRLRSLSTAATSP